MLFSTAQLNHLKLHDVSFVADGAPDIVKMLQRVCLQRSWLRLVALFLTCFTTDFWHCISNERCRVCGSVSQQCKVSRLGQSEETVVSTSVVDSMCATANYWSDFNVENEKLKEIENNNNEPIVSKIDVKRWRIVKRNPSFF